MITPDEYRNLDPIQKRRALLAVRHEKEIARSARERAQVRRSTPTGSETADDAFPLSDLQEGFFVARCAPELDPVGCHYYLEFSVSDLDVDRLEQAWQKLFRHHPMLRARVDKSAAQSIVPQAAAPHFTRHHIGSDQADMERHLEAIRAELSHKVYAIGSWPLFEIHVTESASCPSRIHVSMDSWIADRTSARILFHQWQMLYDNPTQELAPQTASFRDFVLDTRAARSTPEYQKCMTYWQERLASLPPSPALPYRAVPESLSSSFRGERRRFAWTSSSEQWQQIKKIAFESKLTPSVILLGILAEQFHTAGCGDTFAFLLTRDARPGGATGSGEVIGPFNSSSVFVLQHQPHLLLADRLHSYQRQLLRDLDHRAVSATAILRSRARGPAQKPLAVVFTSSLGTQAASSSWLENADYAVSQTPGVDLDMQADEVQGSLVLSWDVAVHRFEPGAIEAIFERTCECLQTFASRGLVEFAYELLDATARRIRLAALAREGTDDPSFPLSELQQSHLAVRIASPTQPTCSVYREFAITDFDPSRLQTAINKIVNGSESLRSMIAPERGQMSELTVAFYRAKMDDLRGIQSESERLAQLSSTRQAMEALFRARPAWPYFAIKVSLIPANGAIVHLVLDMVVFDGASVCQFVEELHRSYNGAPTSFVQTSSGPSYAHYARARAAYLRTSAWTCDRLYWRNRFSRPPSSSPHAPAVSQPIYQRFEMRAPGWQVLKRAMKLRGLPAWTLPLVAYREAVRSRSASTPEPVLLVDFQDRLLAPGGFSYGDCSSIGWFLSQDRTTASAAEQCVSAAAEVATDLAHAWGSPLSEVRKQDSLRPVFVLTNCIEQQTAASAEMRQIYASSSTPGVGVDLILSESDGDLLSSWQVDLSRIPRDRAQRFVDRYQAILNLLAEDETNWDKPFRTPDRHGENATMTEQDVPKRRSSPLDRLNQTDTPYNRQQCIHQLIEMQAARTPESPALISDQGSLTYRQMDEQANRIARLMLRHGIRNGSHVGVLLDRSLEMAVLLLGILKAGGSYVPLAISDPPARREAMMQQAKVTAVVTELKHRSAVQATDERKIIVLDVPHPDLSVGDDAAPLSLRSSPEDTAYIIFTSGSTGVPKGVVVQHRPVINLIEWAKRTYRIGPADRVLFVNSLGFDLSVFDLFGILACGGSVRIASEQDRMDPTCLARILTEEPITFWNSAPAYLEFALTSLKARDIRRLSCPLRLIFLSGDWIPLSLPGELRSLFPKAAIVSLGGATEATVWSNHFDIGEVDPGWRSIPYGRPIQNARYYILHEDLSPCAAGEAGELYIGGECLSAGYCNSPDLTAKAFIPDPYHELPGMIMYRTGDLARLMDENNIELLGRVDNQVKLRGFRVELGEVESAMLKVGLHRPIAVIRGSSTSRTLTAFHQKKGDGHSLSELEIQRRLAEYLPPHMLPSQIVALTELPITVNGKIDRQLLTEQPLAAIRSQKGAENEVTKESGDRSTKQIEDQLCSILAQAMSLDPREVAVATDFGSLGVNSLHLALFSEKGSQVLNRTISLVQLFRCTCIADVIAMLADGVVAASPADAISNATQAPEPSRRSEAVVGAAPVVATVKPAAQREEYAVIGFDVSMPNARNAEEFWANIVNGTDCVTDVPSSRWTGTSTTAASNGVEKAAFIEGIDLFDAAFFGISPREAERMDPRQRLLLQCAWRSFEHAAYSPAAFRNQPVGVFIGVNGDEYASLLRNMDHPIDELTLTGTGRSFIANRLSYYFGWSGPSEVIDTTCSSSLVAVHNAIQAIEAGDCEIALAGGINILIDPVPHRSLARVGVLSPDGACRSFDVSANGYVRGEGFGFVLLKPLSRALADRDCIHAVISGTAINHGGRASSFSAPNPSAQASVIKKALLRASVEPAQIGYIEAHGTGTPLGDPIEIEGIKEAFARRPEVEHPGVFHRVSIGSVKTIIGHLEAAAGIAGLIKVILMLHHRVLPPVGHLKRINPRIDVTGTGFSFQNQALPWESLVDSNNNQLPRAAGVSAFGFGGVNAHAIVREAPKSGDQDQQHPQQEGPLVVVLSAGRREQLMESAENLQAALHRLPPDASLTDVAFTLCTGRAALKHRLAIVTSSLEELATRLANFRQGIDDARIQQGVAIDGAGWRVQALLPGTSERNDAVKPDALVIARRWVGGDAADWLSMFRGTSPRRIPLPVFPFARKRFWPEGLSASLLPGRTELPQAEVDEDKNIVKLNADVPFLADHRMDGIRTLPASAYLALAFQTSLPSLEAGQTVTVSDMVWTRPLQLEEDEPESLLRLQTQNKNGVLYLIFSSRRENRWVDHCSGRMMPGERLVSQPAIHLEQIRERCSTELPSHLCYRRLQEKGASYGPSLQGLRTFRWGKSEALAHVVLPLQGRDGGFAAAVTSLLDAAFQTTLLHEILENNRNELYLPFSARQVSVQRIPPAECLIYAARAGQTNESSSVHKYNLLILDLAGNRVAALEGCAGVAYKRQNTRTQLFREVWRERVGADAKDRRQSSYIMHITVGLPRLADALLASGRNVAANVALPARASAHSYTGAAVAWDALMASPASDANARNVAVWYNCSRLSSLPVEDQLTFGFDTIFELIRQLGRSSKGATARAAILLVGNDTAAAPPLLAALSGFARAAQQEYTKLAVKIITCYGIDEEEQIHSTALETLDEIMAGGRNPIEHRVDLRRNVIETRDLKSVAIDPARSSLPVVKGGIYLVSGGGGAIGTVLARALIEQGGRVVLIGRSSKPPAWVASDAAGGRATYFSSDVGDSSALHRLKDGLERMSGELRGVLHCAGTAHGALLTSKSAEAARLTLRAKVQGTINLDELTKDDPLDFFVMFSSLASVTGTVGNSDYAYANRFLDLYADQRQRHVEQGVRRGVTVSISWPFWSDGAMQPPARELSYLLSQGMEQIDTSTALHVLAQCVRNGGGHFICSQGKPAWVDAVLKSGYATRLQGQEYARDTGAPEAQHVLAGTPQR